MAEAKPRSIIYEVGQTIITKSSHETKQVGRSLAKTVGSTVCLFGDLGSGKTTFVQGFAEALGIRSRLLSPTFIIVRRYNIPKSVRFFYHIDLYRVQRKEELIGLGLKEILADPSATVVIEWAEKLGDLLPKNRVDVKFRVKNDGSHTIWISS